MRVLSLGVLTRSGAFLPLHDLVLFSELCSISDGMVHVVERLLVRLRLRPPAPRLNAQPSVSIRKMLLPCPTVFQKLVPGGRRREGFPGERLIYHAIGLKAFQSLRVNLRFSFYYRVLRVAGFTSFSDESRSSHEIAL